MLADPQTVTINSVANTLAATSRGVNVSEYTKADGGLKLSIRHTLGTRNRRVIRIDSSKIVPDLNSINREVSMSTYLVMDTPKIGYTVAEAKLVVDGLLAFLTASSGASVSAVLGGQS
jgi:hypothetical protein